MTNRIIVLMIFVVIISSCNSNNNNNFSGNPKEMKSTSDSVDNDVSTSLTTSDNDKYAFIVGIKQIGDTTFIDADYIQYLTGQAAIDAAIKFHEADTLQTNDGNTHIDVPNDYFILNESKRIRRLIISKTCSIELVINLESKPPIKDNSLESLKKLDGGTPFLLTFNDEGIVIKIKQIFVP